MESGELDGAVFVEFDDSTMKCNILGIGVRIPPTNVKFDAIRGEGKVKGRTLPLIFCWEVTIHKLQEATLDKLVVLCVLCCTHLFANDQAYVAFRVL